MNNPIPIGNKYFQKIICFYLFECPARTIRVEDKKQGESITKDQPHPTKRFVYGRISQRGRTLSERGFNGGKLNSLRAAMIRSVETDFELLVGNPVRSSEKKQYVSLAKKEFITEGIFAFIRNSFAHGEFDVSNGVYHFENHSKGQIKGKAVLREATLLKWMDIVNMSPDDVKLVGK